jgi:hypothetical protein
MVDDLKILPGQVTQLTTRPVDREAFGKIKRETARRDPPAWSTVVSKGGGPAHTHIEVPPDALDWMTPRGPCQECGERPATILWAPDGTMGMIHGGYRYWCNRCALRVQVEHARLCAARLPELERQLAEEEAR